MGKLVVILYHMRRLKLMALKRRQALRGLRTSDQDTLQALIDLTDVPESIAEAEGLARASSSSQVSVDDQTPLKRGASTTLPKKTPDEATFSRCCILKSLLLNVVLFLEEKPSSMWLGDGCQELDVVWVIALDALTQSSSYLFSQQMQLLLLLQKKPWQRMMMMMIMMIMMMELVQVCFQSEELSGEKQKDQQHISSNISMTP